LEGDSSTKELRDANDVRMQDIYYFLIFQHVSTTSLARQDEEIRREKKLIRNSTRPLRAGARCSSKRGPNCICRRYPSVLSTKTKSRLSRFKLFNKIFFTSSRFHLATQQPFFGTRAENIATVIFIVIQMVDLQRILFCHQFIIRYFMARSIKFHLRPMIKI